MQLRMSLNRFYLSVKFLICVSLWGLSTVEVVATPLLAEPKLNQVSTLNGLSQDTVNALLMDDQGFLWIGTETGLNRYDGYRTSSIDGLDGALQEIPIYSLFQDSQSNIWIGTGTGGVALLDIETSLVKLVGDWRFKFQPDWYQYASHFVEDGAGRIWIALNEQVIAVNPDDLSADVRYELDDTAIIDEQSIRHIWVDEHVLLVATTSGLIGVDLVSNRQVELNFLGEQAASIDNRNVKYLDVDQDNNLWIGTVEGLYSMRFDQVKAYILGQINRASGEVRIKSLNIWQIVKGSNSDYFIGTNRGLYSYAPTDDQLQHVLKLTDSRLLLTDDDIVDIVKDSHGNLWLGSQFDGVLHWSPKSTYFTNVINTSNGQKSFSDNNVWSLYQQKQNELWVGTNNGLNLYSLVSGESQPFLVSDDLKAPYSSSSINQIIPASDNELWLITATGLSKFNSETKQLIPTNAESDVLMEPLWGAAKDSQGVLWFVNEDGIFSYDSKAKYIGQVESIEGRINPSLIEFLFIDEAVFPNSLLIAEIGKLWRLDMESKELSVVHQLPKQGLQHFSAVDSFVRDDNGILWIAYPGFGLFGLDAQTLEQKYHYDRRNLLTNNSIYGLQKDSDGNIWMSSHQGLLKFYPDNKHIQQFSYAEGVAASEFNQGAYTRLRDGRMVYGSQKGITLFNPADLSYAQAKNFKVSITSLNVASSPMAMPLRNLEGQSIELEQFDVGISIGFSTLAYVHQKSTQYEYKLTGDREQSFPTIRDPQVSFPQLEPGNYTFSVSAFDPISGVQSEAAEIYIKVNYVWWASPQAYIIYALILLSILAYWWYRGKQHSLSILAAHKEVLKGKERLSLALTASNSNIWEWDAQKRKFYAPRINDELGYSYPDSEMTLDEHLTLIHPNDKAVYESTWSNFVTEPGVGLDIVFRMKAKDGHWHWFRDLGRSVGEVRSIDQLVVSGTYNNITENVANIEKARLFGEAFKHTRDWVVIFDENRKPVATNQAFCDVFNVDDSKDLEEQIIRIFDIGTESEPRFWENLAYLNKVHHWKDEEQLTIKKGRKRDVLIEMTFIPSTKLHGESDYCLLIMSDVSEQKEAESQLKYMANFDNLTHLPNRTLLLDRVKHAIDHAVQQNTNVGLFFIDLDRFKQVNDSLGHDAGDKLLKIIAQRLTRLLRRDDTVARLGGDEFVVMREEVEHPDKLSAVAQEIIGVIEAPIRLGNQTVSVSSSIGIAVFPSDATDSEELLRNADVAMYHAKEAGRNNFQYFTQRMNEQAQARLVLENQLKKTHQRKGFKNYYQPIVSLSEARLKGFELLMRWPTDEGMVPPDIFIPIAEELGVIEDMTWDALERALPLLKQWNQVDSDIYLSVNLSARHFEGRIPITDIVSLLERHDLDVSTLRFEITESALMRDYERSLKYIERMREYGFIIALDDFGTGYSSLKYLKEFPIQVLKVDKSFVDDIGKNKNNEALILTTLRMAESLDMYCVAEGIEDQNQINFFKKHGCDLLQGYFFSKPLPDEETLDLIKKSWLI